MDRQAEEAARGWVVKLRRPLPAVPDLSGRVSPEVMTELMLAILNRGVRQ